MFIHIFILLQKNGTILKKNTINANTKGNVNETSIVSNKTVWYRYAAFFSHQKNLVIYKKSDDDEKRIYC